MRFRKCGVRPRSRDQASVLPFHNLRFCRQKTSCARRFSIFPSTSDMMTPHRVIQQQRRHPRQHPVVAETSKGRCRKPNNDPSLSPPHVDYTATASLRTSYRNFKRLNGTTNGNAAVRPQFLPKYN